MPEQQREPVEHRGQSGAAGRPDATLRQGRRRRGSPARHAAAGHENEVETDEKVQLDGLGRAVVARIAAHVAAAESHRRPQPRPAPPGQTCTHHVEETIQHHPGQLPEELTVSQVSCAVPPPLPTGVAAAFVLFYRLRFAIVFVLLRKRNLRGRGRAHSDSENNLS